MLPTGALPALVVGASENAALAPLVTGSNQQILPAGQPVNPERMGTPVLMFARRNSESFPVVVLAPIECVPDTVRYCPLWARVMPLMDHPPSVSPRIV